MRAEVRVGTLFPDYRLPDHTGQPRTQSEIQGDDRMIIVLAREAVFRACSLMACPVGCSVSDGMGTG